jgi:hypothetical protein
MDIRHTLLFAVLGSAALALACNTSGLSNQPRATFSQIACLDVNRDHRISDADAADPSELPDFNADDARDEDDAAFLRDVDIAIDPAFDYAQCDGEAKDTPEYLVAHGYFDPSDVSCEGDARPVLLIGVGGGAVNVKDKDDAAGVRKVVDKLLGEYEDLDVDAIAVIAGPAIAGGANPNAAMEDWLANATRVYLERYPCLRTVLIGHSLGAVVVDVVGARLEDQYKDRMIAVVDIDRVSRLGELDFYAGDETSRPGAAFIFNIYETNDPMHADPYDVPNAENWDASEVEGTDGEPVDHTTIDNAPEVHERIVEEVIERSEHVAQLE